MTRLLSTLIFLFAVCNANASEQQTTAPPTDQTPSGILYQQLVQEILDGKTDVNYTLLRLSYAQTDNYDPWGSTTQVAFMDAWKSFQNKDCTTALKDVDTVLASDFTRIAMHSVREACLRQAGDKERADKEFAVGKGLNDLLLHSGDGKSQETAYVVISLKEEGYVLSALGCRETMQALVMGRSHSYDVLTCTVEKTGEVQNVDFQIDNVTAGEMKMFHSKK